MKKLCILFFALISATIHSQTQNTYPLQVAQSIINWKGTYAFQFSEHNGTVNFIKGELSTANGDIVGGFFEVDMTSITNPDYEETGDGPVAHLKDPDFFDVKKFPKAILVITDVIYFEDSNDHKILADLTIKGITQPIEFWPTLVDGDKKILKTRLKIDRTRWGITYNNKLKNHAISEAIEFDVTLQF
ncbi:YceI family protein [Aureisphaera galaxeae]|uniref:YceI family protein n=1 Tax=Aureisphaera galaxeae TaxID=1538023 RepID=UPI00235103C0|nr:YceI family protein [Aureisphaera galaxeae]MDC8004314.1 YceI family protein [Aureisphaera galaxeae]